MERAKIIDFIVAEIKEIRTAMLINKSLMSEADEIVANLDDSNPIDFLNSCEKVREMQKEFNERGEYLIGKLDAYDKILSLYQIDLNDFIKEIES